MHTVKVRNTTIGEGKPKICIPIVGRTAAEIIQQAENIRLLPADIVEWRTDWYEDILDMEKMLRTAHGLRNALDDIPLLFTFRTAQEGGEKTITRPQYEALNIAAAKSGSVDLIDVEAFTESDTVTRIIQTAHASSVRVIASNHDFIKTPEESEIIRRLCKMQELGADIAKIAVMPKSKQDVMTLLSATLKMHENYADRPIVTMSMSGTGAVSRIIGEFTGSALTFGTAGKASAPGQIGACELNEVLEIIHQYAQIPKNSAPFQV